MNWINQIHVGDCRDLLKRMAVDGVRAQTCITSPPYFGLRDYGTGKWEGGDPACDHARSLGGTYASTLHHWDNGLTNTTIAEKVHSYGRASYRSLCGKCGARRIDQQIGLETTPDEYVDQLVKVFRAVRDVLAHDGTLWLVLGDSYAGSWGNQGRKAGRGTQRPINAPMMQVVDDSRYPSSGTKTGSLTRTPGLKNKDLIGIPWMVAFALREDGWYLRSDVIWSKPNPMPESVTDRPTKSHEYLFLLAASERYYYDSDAIREPDAGQDHRRNILQQDEPSGGILPPHSGIRRAEGRNGSGRNRRTVWTIPSMPFRAAHFATFPRSLVEPCILAGTSTQGHCSSCGNGQARIVESEKTFESGSGRSGKPIIGKNADGRVNGGNLDIRKGPVRSVRTIGWRPTCKCGASFVPGIVLDPFAGSGTVPQVADSLGRAFIGCELNPEYARMYGRDRAAQIGAPL